MADWGGKIGAGGKLEVNTGTFIDVGLVRDFTFNLTVGEEDVTHQQSSLTPPYAKRYIPGSVNAEVTFSILFDPLAAGHKATVLDLLGLDKPFKYTFADGSVWTFTAFYRSPSFEIPSKSPLTGDLTLRIKGAPTFAGA
jgi:hypothetical protein